MADGQLGGITVFSGSIDAVASVSNIAACLEKKDHGLQACIRVCRRG